jgi:hypothetical protein
VDTARSRSRRRVELPAWFTQRFDSRYQETQLFDAKLRKGFGLQPLPNGSPGVPVSVPERALLEKTLDELLNHSTRIKVVRLAELLATDLDLPWAALAKRHSQRLGEPSFVDCFVAYLAGHNRPVHEVLFPKQLPLEPAFTNEFAGMTRYAIAQEEFSLAKRDAEQTESRRRLTALRAELAALDFPSMKTNRATPRSRPRTTTPIATKPARSRQLDKWPARLEARYNAIENPAPSERYAAPHQQYAAKR